MVRTILMPNYSLAVLLISLKLLSPAFSTCDINCENYKHLLYNHYLHLLAQGCSRHGMLEIPDQSVLWYPSVQPAWVKTLEFKKEMELALEESDYALPLLQNLVWTHSHK